VINIGKEWIDETNNESFVKINQFLVTETSECLRRCSSILDENDVMQTTVEHVHRNASSNEEAHDPDDKQGQQTVKQTLEQKTMSTSHAKEINISIQNLKQQVKQNERMSKQLQAETEQSFHLKFEAVMRELDAASNFMSNLQSKMESLSSQVKEMSKFDNASDLIDRLHSVDVTVTEHHKKIEELQQESTENNILRIVHELLIERGILTHQTLRENSDFEKLHEDLKFIKDSQDQVQISLQKHDENIRGLETNFKDSETLRSKHLQDLKKEMQSKYELLNGLKSQSESTRADYKQIETYLKRLGLNFDKLKQENTDLSTQISTLSVTSANDKREQIEKISSIESKNNDVSSRVDQLWSRNVAYQDSNFQKFKEDLSEIEKSQSKKFKFINQKLENLETANTTLKDMDKKNDLKFEEIKKELHSSSGVMTILQSKNESLCTSMMEKTVEINEVRQTLNEIIEQNVTNASNLNSAIARNGHELNKRLSDNTNTIEALQSQSNYQSMTMNAMEINFKSIATEVNSIKRKVEEPVAAAAARRQSIEMHSNDQAEQFNFSKFQHVGAVNADDESDDDEPVGFDARVHISALCELFLDETLSCFTSVTDDPQDDFDPETGIFTVPSDGLYLCGLFIDIITFLQCDLVFNIFVRESDNSETIIGRCHCRHRNSTVSDVVIRQLRANDELFIRPGDNYGNIQFSSYSHFMCALINRQ
ncbi:synaptonemal complex protein 1, partial [Biomphalaria glabrata]